MSELKSIKYSLLKYVIEESENTLFTFLEIEDHQSNSNKVVVSIYRRIIGLSKKILCIIENGISEGLELDYRGLFETYMNFEYIFKDAENNSENILKRTDFYKINHHNYRLKVFERALSRNNEELKEEILSHIEKEKQLLKDTTVSSNRESYDCLKKNHKKTGELMLPKWFSINENLTTYNKLANYIDDTDNLLSSMYGDLSVVAHGETCLQNINNNPDQKRISINPFVISLEESLSANETILDMTRAILLSTLKLFNQFIFFTNESNYNKFINEINPIIKEIHSNLSN